MDRLRASEGCGAALDPRAAGAAPKAMSVLHGSSFIKEFDQFFQQKLASAYEKLTGIKVTYELTSVGSLQTRITIVAETRSGPEITATGFNRTWLFDQSLVQHYVAEMTMALDGATLPRRKRLSPVRPCVPMTSASAR